MSFIVLRIVSGRWVMQLANRKRLLTFQNCFRLRASHLDELSDLTWKIRCREGEVTGILCNFGLNGVEELWTSQSFDGTEKGNEAFDPENRSQKHMCHMSGRERENERTTLRLYVCENMKLCTKSLVWGSDHNIFVWNQKSFSNGFHVMGSWLSNSWTSHHWCKRFMKDPMTSCCNSHIEVKWLEMSFAIIAQCKKTQTNAPFLPQCPRCPVEATDHDGDLERSLIQGDMMTCGLSMFEPSAKSVDYIDLSLACHFYTEMMIMMVIVELGLVMPYLVTQVNTGWNPATKGTKDVHLKADFWGTNVPATFAPMANREASWVVSPKARKSSEHQILTCNMELDSWQGLLPEHMTPGLLMLCNWAEYKTGQMKAKC